MAPSISYLFTRNLRLERVELGDGTVVAYNALKAQKILPASFVAESLVSLRAVRYLTPFLPRSSQIARSVP